MDRPAGQDASVRRALVDWTRQLARAGVPSPDHDARALLADVLRTTLPALVLVERLDDGTRERTQRLVDRRARREPLQHIIGSCEFLGLSLTVGPGVFIPRPETEELADWVIRSVPVGAAARIVDLCTGSGALALALAAHVPGSDVVGVELSADAVSYAAANLALAGRALVQVGSRCRIQHGDATGVADSGGLLRSWAGSVEIVVTNPPYIPAAAVPQEEEVRVHDPDMALFGGPDGLDVVRQLVGQAELLLAPGGWLVIEHADVQGEDAGPAGVPGLLRASGWQHVVDHRDLSGRPRFTSGRAAGRPSGGSGIQQEREDP